MSLERLLTVEELAQETGMTEGEIRAAIAEGDLPFLQRKPRTRIRISESEFTAWRERHTHQPPQAVKPIFVSPEKAAVSTIDQILGPRFKRRFSRPS